MYSNDKESIPSTIYDKECLKYINHNHKLNQALGLISISDIVIFNLCQ